MPLFTREHLGRKAVLITVGFLLAGSTPVIVSSVAAASPGEAILRIEGHDSFVRNQSFTSSFHFADQPLNVRQGQKILIDNLTNDSHTITLVSARDLPGNVRQVNNCGLCNEVNNVYFPPGSQGPAGVQIDHGVITDDDSAPDADTPDPAVPPGPFNAFIEDFDSVSRTNPGAPSTIGDSTLIDAKGSNNQGGPTKRTVVVTARPGTYRFMCTFHPWMQGTLVVS
jgi:plastocyanin